eukprot:110111-Pelagomonas_calceolata.AAC.6
MQLLNTDEKFSPQKGLSKGRPLRNGKHTVYLPSFVYNLGRLSKAGSMQVLKKNIQGKPLLAATAQQNPLP